MSAFGGDIFEPASFSQVELDVYTTHYRVSGTVSTRFGRVSDILNQLSSSHIPLVRATISEYDDPANTTTGAPLWFIGALWLDHDAASPEYCEAIVHVRVALVRAPSASDPEPVSLRP